MFYLLGDEYAHILQNLESYCKRFNFMKYSKKTHPECIYTDPQSNFIMRKIQLKTINLLERWDDLFR